MTSLALAAGLLAYAAASGAFVGHVLATSWPRLSAQPVNDGRGDGD